MTDGAMTDGAMTDGAMTDGAMTDGAMTDGAMTDGAMTDGAMTDGAMTDGAMTDGRVLVTGATGFLGGALVDALAADGREVVATGRDATGCAALARRGVEVHRIDLAVPGAAEHLVTIGRIDSLVHCAALSAPWGPLSGFRAVNVEGTRAVLAAARRMGCRHVVAISSPTVYFRFLDQFGLREGMDLPAPVNAYARSKAEAEALVAAAEGMGRTILRPRALYGRGDRALLPRMAAACARGPIPLLRGGRAVTDPTHVDDVVAALLAVLRHGSPEGLAVFNVSGGEAVPVRHLIEAAAMRLGVRPRWRRLPWAPVLAAATASEAARALVGAAEPPITRYTAGILAFSQTLDISAIRDATGWQPRIGFAEGLERTFA